MIDVNKQTTPKDLNQYKQRSYNEIIEYLDKHWFATKEDKTLAKIKKLDQELNNPSKKISAILVNGTNGKSLTAHLTSKLLQEEGLKVGIFYNPHILTYNERFVINNETISNKIFTEIANDIINTSEQSDIKANSYEILTMMAIQYFIKENVDVSILEVNKGGVFNATNICNAKVATITRVTPTDTKNTNNLEDVKNTINDMMGIVKPGTWIVSGDQNKIHLQLMNDLTEVQGGNWAMPIRKLAPLAYPFEQLHGRCGAIAERLAQMYVENFHNNDATITKDTLLSKQKGKRGRPTIEEKRKPQKKTVEQFWKEETTSLPGRFQLLDKEKPSVLLDTASNTDAFKNVLLGIKLLHYQRPLKGLAIILGASENTLNDEEFLKLIRYFFKKTSGQLIICPIKPNLQGVGEDKSWNTEKITNDIKSMKIKARTCNSFEEAFETAKKTVDERYGLVVITGSRSIVNNYWKYKGIKKF